MNTINPVVNQYPYVSVIITTRNRPENLKLCIESLLKTNYPNKEIIVVDQSQNNASECIVHVLNSSIIRYFHIKSKGVSIGKNFAVNNSLHPILCFTDDDCIVPSDWLIQIAKCYKPRPNISAIFGQVLSKTDNPSVSKTVGQFVFDKIRTYSSLPPGNLPRLNGNNWSIKKAAFLKTGGFKHWLGPGSIGYGAEEYELMFRLLSKQYEIVAEPKIYIYHLHQVSRVSNDILRTRYGSGFFMFCAYYRLFGKTITNRYIVSFLQNQSKRKLNQFRIAFNKKSLRFAGYLVFISMYEIYYYLRGYIIGLIIAATEIVLIKGKNTI